MNLRNVLPVVKLCLLIGGVMLLAVGSASANALFRSSVAIDGGVPVVRTSNDLRDLVELFDDSSLSQVSGTYVAGVSSVDAVLDLRGLKARLTYNAGSSQLRLEIPSAGVDITFTGGSRDENQEALRDFLKNGRKGINAVGTGDLTGILQSAVQYSAVDPVAGNPNSLQTLMLLSDYRKVIYGQRIPVDNLPDGVEPPVNVFFVEAGYGNGFEADTHHLDLLSLHLGTFINLEDRHWTVILELPITMSFAEGSESLLTYPGAGFVYRVNNYWSLTTMLRGGAAGSVKVGGLGFLYSATVTSYLQFPLDDLLEGLTIGWAFMGGVNNSIDEIEIEEYDLSYELQNYPLRTGLDVQGPLPFRMFDMPNGWGVYGAYTHWFGTELYMIDMGEVGVSFSLKRVHDEFAYDRTRIEFGYEFGKSYSALSARLTFGF